MCKTVCGRSCSQVRTGVEARDCRSTLQGLWLWIAQPAESMFVLRRPSLGLVDFPGVLGACVFADRSGVNAGCDFRARLRHVRFCVQRFALTIHQVRLHDMETIAFVPRSLLVSLSLITFTGGSVEILVNQTGCGLNNSNRKWGLLHALKRSRESSHVGYLTGHEEL